MTRIPNPPGAWLRGLAAGALFAALLPCAAPALADDAFGAAIDDAALTQQRGGTLVVNDMALDGVVAENQAFNLNTGNNAIADGALSGATGMPMVVQNSGNNVLIQNATIVNVQVQ